MLEMPFFRFNHILKPTAFLADSQYFLKQSIAAVFDISPCGLKISGVPGVRDFPAGTLCIIHQQMHLLIGIALANALHIADIRLIHADQQIIPVVVTALHLSGRCLLYTSRYPRSGIPIPPTILSFRLSDDRLPDNMPPSQCPPSPPDTSG